MTGPCHSTKRLRCPRKIPHLRLLLTTLLLLFLLLTPSCTRLRSWISPSPSPIQVWLKWVRQGNQSVQSFAARGEIILEAPKLEYRGRHTMAALGADLFLVKVLTPANAPILYMLGRGSEVTMVDFSQRIVYRSPIKDGKFRLARGMWLPSALFSRVAAGKVPLVTRPSAMLKKGREQNEALLILKEQGFSDVRQEIRLELDPPYRVKGFSLTRWDEVEYEVRFQDYQSQTSRALPRTIVIELPRIKARIIIRHRQILINPELKPEQFRVEIPTYFRLVEEKP